MFHNSCESFVSFLFHTNRDWYRNYKYCSTQVELKSHLCYIIIKNTYFSSILKGSEINIVLKVATRF